MIADTSLSSGNDTLQLFINTNLNTGLGTLMATEQALMNNDLATATSTLNGYIPANNIEANYQTFYNSYIRQQTNGILTIPDSVALFNLANGCPHTDGAVVFQARALFNGIFNQAITFEDHCVFTHSNKTSFDGNNSGLKTQTVDQRFVLYPNPNNGAMFISFSDPSQKEYIIRICDIRGKLILEKHLFAEGGVANIDVPLDNGMYFITMILPDGMSSGQQKIVISK